MTAPVEELYVVVDADLDTADDDSRHLKHSVCQPGPGPSIGHCGEPFIATGEIVVRVMRDMCHACVAHSQSGTCPRCGGSIVPLRWF